MNRIHYLLITLLLILSSGCSKPTIDASSDEAIKLSSQKVRESLPEERRSEFDEALQVLMFSQIDIGEIFTNGIANKDSIERKIRIALNGKTADQVISEATKIKAEREAREREQAINEIKELEKSQKDAEHAREELKKFKVLRSRFYMRDQKFVGKQPIIELSVKNETGLPISRAYFTGTIASPERSIPWHQDTFNYSISGGLETGEEATWNLAPNMFSAWGKVNAPIDAIFTVTVEKLDGPNGKTLYSAREFGKKEEERLAELKSKYGIN